MPTTLRDAFGAACDARVLPGTVLLAADKSGNFRYSHAFGTRALEGPLEKSPITSDSVMLIASCTKLVTSIAALQCVERGLIGLDDDVRSILHELQDIDILERGPDSTVAGKRKNTVPITLRQLLAHTAGFNYEFNDKLLENWRAAQPMSERRPFTTVPNRYTIPLIFEPGTSWAYSPSTDWVGVLIERLTKCTLEEYMTTNIRGPLGIKDMTFALSTRPDMQDRGVRMSVRNVEEGPESRLSYSRGQLILAPDLEGCHGGGGIYTSPAEFMKVLHGLLVASDAPESEDITTPIPPKQLLRRSTIDAMFTPQLGEPAKEAMQVVAETPLLNRMMCGVPTEARKDFGLAGMLVLEDLPGSWRKGTMAWCGAPNLTWWIDREAGLCGLYASQLVPIGDAKTFKMLHLFEKEVYSQYEEAMHR